MSHKGHKRKARKCKFRDNRPGSDWVTCDHTDNPTALKVCSEEHCPGSEGTMPLPGDSGYESMVDFMRADLACGMGYTNLIEAARKSIEARGLNFEEEFNKSKAV